MKSLNIHSQLGLSLIELLIGLVLGGIVAAMIGTVFVQGQQSFTTQKELNNINDDASFILDVIIDDIASAGYAGDDRFSNPASEFLPAVVAVIDDGGTRSVTFDGGPGPDTITIVYRADLLGNQTVDCRGEAPVTQATTVFLADATTPYQEVYIFNQYFVDDIDVATGLGSLKCKTWQSRAIDNPTSESIVDSVYSLTVDGVIKPEVELVSNVAAFEVLYGVDTSVTQTVSASGASVVSVVNIDGYVPWSNAIANQVIRSVRVGFALASDEAVRDVEQTITLSVLDNLNAVNQVSRRQYVMYEKNIELKNTRGQIREE